MAYRRSSIQQWLTQQIDKPTTGNLKKTLMLQRQHGALSPKLPCGANIFKSSTSRRASVVGTGGMFTAKPRGEPFFHSLGQWEENGTGSKSLNACHDEEKQESQDMPTPRRGTPCGLTGLRPRPNGLVLCINDQNVSPDVEADSEMGSWSSLCEEEQRSQAVEVLQLLVGNGSYVPINLLYRILRSCIAKKDLVVGRCIHELVLQNGYQANCLLANHVIRMYSSHGWLQEAANVFLQLESPDSYIWSSIILAHVDCGQPVEAIDLYRRMRQSRVMPDNHTFVAVLKACANATDLKSGREVHVDILKTASEPDEFVVNCLIDMYAKCGSVGDARRLFDSSSSKNIVTWTAMLTGYSQHGAELEALTLYASMQNEGMMSADRVVFLCLLKACANIAALDQGKQLHKQIREQGLGVQDLVVGNCLVDMYVKCGSLHDARQVFDRLPVKDAVTWATMIAGYAQQELGQDAVALFASMQKDGVSPANDVTFSCLLRACASIGALHEGKRLHSQVEGRGLALDVVIGNSLVDMYSKCGSLDNARRVFDGLATKDVVTWNVMISGYVQYGLAEEALTLYASMVESGITKADLVTDSCMLKACAAVGALDQGKVFHSQIARAGPYDLLVQNGLVDMYAKCGSFEEACKVLEGMESKSVATWNAMLTGYAQHGLGQKALRLFARMQQECSAEPDEVTFACVLKACASEGALAQGQQVHTQVCNRGLESGVLVGSCLVDMYAKCGSLVDARRVFERLGVRDVVSWSAMLSGYAQHGLGREALQLYEQMQLEGIEPNAVTFLSLFAACSHAGLVDKGVELFKSMREEYGFTPEMGHYVGMIDLFGRAGYFSRLEQFMRSMPLQPDLAMWLCVLGACRKHGNVVLAEKAFSSAIVRQPKDAAAYILMAHIYSGAGLLDEVKKVEKLRNDAGALKEPGRSWIEYGHELLTFQVHDAVDFLSVDKSVSHL